MGIFGEKSDPMDNSPVPKLTQKELPKDMPLEVYFEEGARFELGEMLKMLGMNDQYNILESTLLTECARKSEELHKTMGIIVPTLDTRRFHGEDAKRENRLETVKHEKEWLALDESNRQVAEAIPTNIAIQVLLGYLNSSQTFPTTKKVCAGYRETADAYGDNSIVQLVLFAPNSTAYKGLVYYRQGYNAVRTNGAEQFFGALWNYSDKTSLTPTAEETAYANETSKVAFPTTELQQLATVQGLSPKGLNFIPYSA